MTLDTSILDSLQTLHIPLLDQIMIFFTTICTLSVMC